MIPENVDRGLPMKTSASTSTNMSTTTTFSGPKPEEGIVQRPPFVPLQGSEVPGSGGG